MVRIRPPWRTISNGPPAFMMTNNSWRTRRHADQCQLTKSAGLGLVANLPVPRRSYFGLAVAETRRPFRLFGPAWGWGAFFGAAAKVGAEVAVCIVVRGLGVSLIKEVYVFVWWWCCAGSFCCGDFHFGLFWSSSLSTLSSQFWRSQFPIWIIVSKAFSVWRRPSLYLIFAVLKYYRFLQLLNIRRTRLSITQTFVKVNSPPVTYTQSLYPANFPLGWILNMIT